MYKIILPVGQYSLPDVPMKGGDLKGDVDALVLALTQISHLCLFQIDSQRAFPQGERF